MKTTPQSLNWPDAGKRYALALLITLLALLFSQLLHPKVKLDAFNLFQAAVFLSALYGGLGPGILSSVLSILLIDYYFLPPVREFSKSWFDGGINLAVFGALTLITSSLSANLRKAREALQASHDQLEERIRERTDQLSAANERLNQEVQERLEAEKAILKISHREQQRMGQDLHDGLCQTLAGLRLQADVLKDKLVAASFPDQALVDKIGARLSDAIEQADTVARGLYPVELETNGLSAALDEMCRKISDFYSVSCEWVSRTPVDFQDTAVATHLFRIAQESVVNAIKSGKAPRIWVRLFQFQKALHLVIADSGVGIDVDASRKRSGMGLQIMSYRARMIGADLRIVLRPRGGTVVDCRLPFRAA